MNLKKEISFGRRKTGNQPDISGKSMERVLHKTSINLIIKERSDIRPEIAIPAIVIIIVLAALISKFAVVDLLSDLSRAQSRVSDARGQINAYLDEIDSYGDLDDRYAHYTFSGMNETELTTVSRADILSLLREQVIPYAAIGSWSVYYNTVTLEVTADTLQDINLIVQQLNTDDRVEYCTVNTAQTDTDDVAYNTPDDETLAQTDADESAVTAQVTIYMMDVVKGAFEG